MRITRRVDHPATTTTVHELMAKSIVSGDPAVTQISEYMTHSPRTIEDVELVAKAAEIMVKHRVRHLPVTNNGRLIGFLSARDLLALNPWPLNLPIGECW